MNDIFTVLLKLCSECQIDGEDFVNFCGLLRNYILLQLHLPNMSAIQPVVDGEHFKAQKSVKKTVWS